MGGSAQGWGIADTPEGAPSTTEVEIRDVEVCVLSLCRAVRTLARLRERTFFRLTITTVFIATLVLVVVGVATGYLSTIKAALLLTLALGMLPFVMPYYFPQRGEE